MIFFEIFSIALSNGAASSATGIILPHCLSYVNCFFIFLIWGLTGAAHHYGWHCLPSASEKDFSLRSK